MTIDFPIDILHSKIGIKVQDYKEDDTERFLFFRVLITKKYYFE
ncbi:MAG: hypothetical protein ACFE96_10910 [Candidatus Hermodarchaeota archaeon]